MTNPPSHPRDQELIELRVDFPGHRIWRAVGHDGRLGEWVATLRDSSAGVDATCICPTAAELREALNEERERARNRRPW
ncbi:hypothetical protein ABZ801_04805 [Actinomadura sp. NPDC047616]|uniref:hypothetical protein n=1 Tax=Actinomadura sp. NPDC047616 TaxID=3155914 RepID=UPI0033DCB104